MRRWIISPTTSFYAHAAEKVAGCTRITPSRFLLVIKKPAVAGCIQGVVLSGRVRGMPRGMYIRTLPENGAG